MCPARSKEGCVGGNVSITTITRVMSKSSQQDLGQLSCADHLYVFTVCVFFSPANNGSQMPSFPRLPPKRGPG